MRRQQTQGSGALPVFSRAHFKTSRESLLRWLGGFPHYFSQVVDNSRVF
jgi:hypothetical protein